MAPQPALFTILDAVVANLRATTGYSSPTGNGIPVFDGAFAGQNDAPATYVCIGWTQNGEKSATVTTLPAVFGPRADRLEEGTFDVTAVASSGYTDPSLCRATLRTVIADLTAAVYGLTDATFAGYWAQVSSLDLNQIQSPSGVTVEAVITFDYRCQQGA